MKEMNENDFRVGDRVIAVDNNIGEAIYRNEIGTIIDVLDWDSKFPWFVTFDKYPDSRIYCTVKQLDTEQDNEQVTRDGYTYTKLKSLSPESVLKGGPCKGEFEKYIDESSDGFFEDQDLNYVLTCSKKNDSWLPWLITHGYIGKEDVRKEPIYDIRIGDEFTMCGRQFVLCQADNYECYMIGITGWDKGNRYTTATKCNDIPRITMDQFQKMCGNNNAKAIYNTKKRG